ncbi:hypothetical protein CR513_20367, partial [Mucuna pruriens]
MCPTLQETEVESIECVRALGGGYQYGRQSEPYQLNLYQAQHTTPRFGPVGTMLGPSQGNYQHEGPRYQAPTFCQQPQQQMPPRENSPAIEDLIFTISTKYNCHYT